MFAVLILSNAGGLAGAASNIPIMLIFFQLSMAEAVPLSSFIAICSKSFRFYLNFSQKHPNNSERNAIDYEVVIITMPFILLGTYYGVIIGKFIGEVAQVGIFGMTIAWSIFTTL